MSLPRYDSYKDSGVEWIGEIPEGWEVKKLKWLLADRLMYGANESAVFEDSNSPRYIRITDFGDDGKLRDDTFKSLPYEVAAEYLLEEGDVLLARSGATVGKTFQFKGYNGLACFAGYLIKAKPNANLLSSDFLYLFTKSAGYDSWKNSIFSQATIQNIGADKYAYLEIPCPPLPEQTAIASFLDRKTAEIDQLIANKEKLIALYEEEKTAIINRAVTRGLPSTSSGQVPLEVKTRPSGVDWLGDIPEHWEVKRLKYMVSMKSGEGITSDQIKESGDYPVYGGNGLRGYFDSFTHEGDYALIGRQGALCGNINYASGKFWASEHAIVCTLVGNHEVKWLGELLKIMNLNQYSVSAAQPGLSVENIKVLQIPVPPLPEQTAIVTHIETESTRLDAIIEKFKKQIELFKEYRTTLISEVVTGKIDVRGEVGV